jgi:hypothetical protein
MCGSDGALPALAAYVGALEEVIVLGLLGRGAHWAAVVRAALVLMKSFSCWQ